MTNSSKQSKPSSVEHTWFSHRLESSNNDPWQEAKVKVHLTLGVLVRDDAILDRLFSRKVDLVQYR